MNISNQYLSCYKRFYEKYSWLPRYQHMTKQLIIYICHILRETISYSFIASQANISITTVIRTFRYTQKRLYKWIYRRNNNKRFEQFRNRKLHICG